MFDFWFDLPPIFRMAMGFGMMLAAALLWYFSGGVLYWWGFAVLGFFLVLFSRSGDSSGYNF